MLSSHPARMLQVLAIYIENLEGVVATKRGRVSRLLGAEWEPLDAPLRCKVEAVGKSISGKKETKLGKGMLIRFVEEVVDQAVAALELPSSEPAAEAAEPAGLGEDVGLMPPGLSAQLAAIEVALPPAYARLYELMVTERAAKAAKAAKKAAKEAREAAAEGGNGGSGSDLSNDEDDEDDDSEDEDEDDEDDDDGAEPEEGELAAAAGAGGEPKARKPKRRVLKKKKKKSKSWNWRADVRSMYGAIGGLEKLQVRPSSRVAHLPLCGDSDRSSQHAEPISAASPIQSTLSHCGPGFCRKSGRRPGISGTAT